MKFQPTYYAIIPAPIRYHKNLTGDEKLLYGEITALTQSKGYCFADNNYFADLYNVSKETVSRRISKLVKYGFLSREIKYKNNSKEVESRFLKVLPIDNSVNTPCDNNQYPIDNSVNTPIDGIVKDNNTSNEYYKINKEKIYKKSLFPLSAKEEKQVNEFNYLLKEVIDYLNLRAKTNYKHTTRVNQQHIHARVQEGYTLNDFKAVIDLKVTQWISDTKMSKFLRPQTLFSPKMESYLNEPKPKSRVDVAFDNLKENFDMENLLG